MRSVGVAMCLVLGLGACSTARTASKATGAGLGDETSDAASAKDDAASARREPRAGDAAQAPDATSRAEGDAAVDAGEPSSRCGRASDFEAFAADGQELIVDSVTESLDIEVNLLGIGWDPVSDPRYSAETMPWIDRGQCDGRTCFPKPSTYQLDVLGGPETDYAIIAAVPYPLPEDIDGTAAFGAFTNDKAQDLAQTINTALGSSRALFAAVIMPNDRIERQLEEMDRRAPAAAAWVLSPSWTPSGSSGIGYFLDDPLGQQAIERGLALDRPIFIVDKGMSGYSSRSSEYTDPRDIGVAAAQYPDARLIVRHAAFEQGFERDDDRSAWPEGPYDESDPDVQAAYPLTRGVNSLIKSLRDNGIGPNENVYVALDEVWAHLITRPVEAAHVIGKLLKYVGEDNILWATDSVLYGAPYPQIDAFRTFEIPVEMQDQYGYPALTQSRRLKILGINAARLFCLQPE